MYCNHCFYLVGQRHSVRRHNSSAAPDTMLLGQLQRGRPTHQRADKPSAFESPGAVLQEQSSFGSQWRRLHPLSPSLPCYIWIFPPCSSNSSPRINRVPRDMFLKHCYYGLRYSSWLMPSFQEKKGPPSKHKSTQRYKALSSSCSGPHSASLTRNISKALLLPNLCMLSETPLKNAGRLSCAALHRRAD